MSIDLYVILLSYYILVLYLSAEAPETHLVSGACASGIDYLQLCALTMKKYVLWL
jgi:hypothetical protein